MYEDHAAELLPRAKFLRRLLRHVAVAGAALLVSSVVGTAGFHWLAAQDWIDAFLSSSMLLGGMGPVGTVEGSGGKLFAACFALYAGIVFLGISAVVLAPVLHRILHTLHLQERERRK
jgi:hypothetical protein